MKEHANVVVVTMTSAFFSSLVLQSSVDVPTNYKHSNYSCQHTSQKLQTTIKDSYPLPFQKVIENYMHFKIKKIITMIQNNGLLNQFTVI
jgi:hypothetical protein